MSHPLFRPCCGLGWPFFEQSKFQGEFVGPPERPDYDVALELAQAYVEMGDIDGAVEVLAEVTQSGDESQIRRATKLLTRLRGGADQRA